MLKWHENSHLILVEFEAMASRYSSSEVAIICLDLLWTQQNFEGFSHFLDFPCIWFDVLNSPMIRPHNLSSPRFYVTDVNLSKTTRAAASFLLVPLKRLKVQRKWCYDSPACQIRWLVDEFHLVIWLDWTDSKRIYCFLKGSEIPSMLPDNYHIELNQLQPQTLRPKKHDIEIIQQDFRVS